MVCSDIVGSYENGDVTATPEAPSLAYVTAPRFVASALTHVVPSESVHVAASHVGALPLHVPTCEVPVWLHVVLITFASEIT
jgi:hypothetical protein